MRPLVLALAAVLGALSGCSGETVLRIEIPSAGISPAPVAVRVTLVGDGITAAPRTIAPVSFPGVVIVKGIPDGTATVCVAVEGLDDGGHPVVGGSLTTNVAAHAVTRVAVPLADSFARCSAAGDDLGAPGDLAGADLAQPPSPDGAVAICPAGAFFCDDFEIGDLGRWSTGGIKNDLGTLAVQTATVAHGSYALKAVASGANGGNDIFAEVEADFPARQPPLALRAMLFLPAPLTHYNLTVALYDDTVNGFAIGGDGNATWVVTEDQATQPDRHSDMVPVDAGRWHCVELVIDAAGAVTFYVDNHALAGPWQRASAVGYTELIVGVTRSVDPNVTAYLDDVAIGPARLYCP